MKSSPFRFTKSIIEKPANPEALFRDLRKVSINYLWSHQADLLRAYNDKHLSTSDVAIELPTGAGKTLVGLLIGEFRRRANGERVIYLCPTRQLAYQVESQAQSYGIRAHALVGKQKDYPPDKYSEYARSQALAITTYSGIFNTNPKLDDGDVLILDDAHSAESYIASLWTVEINRSESLYAALLDLFVEALPNYFIQDMQSDGDMALKASKVDCVPLPLIYPKIDQLRALLSEGLASDSNSKYAWGLINSHLHACNIYVSWNQIVIRPIIPPTFAHQPFTNAKQRIYMSATLGEGGEIERSLGIARITRLPIPSGWDKQSSGRRLILFPELSLSGSDSTYLLCQAIKLKPRALALCPSKALAESLSSLLAACDERPNILLKEDVEQELDEFVNSSNSVLLLTNRYDGIDLPGDACRLQIVYREPSATNLQEKFFLSRLKASELLRDRIRTRIAQALGRCTRSANDYALILMLGEDLLKFCLKREVQQALHPEMQAELEFGLENSKMDKEEMLEIIKIFFAQSEAWQDADKHIIQLRDEKQRHTDDSVKQLGEAAIFEIEFAKHIWNGDFEAANSQAQLVLDRLGGDDLKPYRGWWYYINGCVSWLRSREENEASAIELARDQFNRAAMCTPSVSWLMNLRRIGAENIQPADSNDLFLARAIENVNEALSRLPTSHSKFEKQMKGFLDSIGGDESKAFEDGLTCLGGLLGFNAEHPDTDAAPDSYWWLEEYCHVVFEAKTENPKPETAIGKNDITQATGHINWLQATHKVHEKEKLVAVIISPRKYLHVDAIPHAEDLYYLNPSIIRKIAIEVVDMYRSIRAVTTAVSSESVREKIREELISRNLSLPRVLEKLLSTPIKTIPTSR